MKPKSIAMLCAALVAALFCLRMFGQEKPVPLPKSEYVTIRWAGKENIHLIRPGGLVEFIGSEVRKLPRPERADERSFYMNIAMNGLTKEGYELAAALPDEIIMSRPIVRSFAKPE